MTEGPAYLPPTEHPPQQQPDHPVPQNPQQNWGAPQQQSWAPPTQQNSGPAAPQNPQQNWGAPQQQGYGPAWPPQQNPQQSWGQPPQQGYGAAWPAQQNPQQNWGAPQQQGYGPAWPPARPDVVELDPEAAGLRRLERPGWGIVPVLLGAAGLVTGLTMRWYDLRTYSPVSGPEVLITHHHRATLFDLDSALHAVTGRHLGGIAGAFAGPLMVVSAVVFVVLAAVGAIGLRRRGLTTAVRIVVPIVVLAIGVLAAYGVDHGLHSATNGRDLDVDGTPAPLFWLGGCVLLAFGGGLGPRIAYRNPDGTKPAGPRPGMPGAVIRQRTVVAATVLAWLATVTAAVTYLALPWFGGGGRTVGFVKIGDAARQASGDGHQFARAYFGWLGFVLLVVFAAAAVLLTVAGAGRIRASVVRPLVVLAALAMAAVHIGGLADLDGHDPQAGPFVLFGALALLLVAGALPVRRTVQVAAPPAWAPAGR